MHWEPLAEWGPLDSDFDELSPPSIPGGDNVCDGQRGQEFGVSLLPHILRRVFPNAAPSLSSIDKSLLLLP